MKPTTSRSWSKVCQSVMAVGCAAMLLPGQGVLLAQSAAPAPASPAAPAEPAEPKLSPDQLDSLVAPIALYPDTLLAQALVASTYPLEIIQLQQWLVRNKDLKDQALTDALAKQPWDPAIQSMAVIPDLVKRLADDIQWTTELGNAFLAQQNDVMDAVQRMRKKAQDKGTLASTEQQKVETKVVEEKTVIIVQQANPEVIYVPTYNPTVVYPPPVYAYPPVYYPPPYSGFVTFSVGVMVGAAVWGGGCGWGHNDITINRNTNINTGGNGNWSHNPEHRGAAPYSNKATSDKFSGSSRGQAGGRSGATSQSMGAGNRGAGASASSRSAATSRASGSGASRSASAGGYNMGSRDFASSTASRSGGFGGDSSGFSGNSARASSSRGSHSMGGRGGGGGRRR